jgi:hypothetical protein
MPTFRPLKGGQLRENGTQGNPAGRLSRKQAKAIRNQKKSHRIRLKNVKIRYKTVSKWSTKLISFVVCDGCSKPMHGVKSGEKVSCECGWRRMVVD